MNGLFQFARSTLFAIVAVMLLVWALWLGPMLERDRQKMLLTSCTNHGHQLLVWFMVRADEDPEWRFPSLPCTEGHLMLMSYSRTLDGALNCNHGATHLRQGGWQAVNLAPQKWKELLDRWPTKDVADGVPLYWCGRPNFRGQRMMVTTQGRFDLWMARVSEDKLVREVERLNQILIAMGERPVPLNVPEKVDWDKAPLWPTNSRLSKKDSITLQ